jgi:hypothetical protein
MYVFLPTVSFNPWCILIFTWSNCKNCKTTSSQINSWQGSVELYTEVNINWLWLALLVDILLESYKWRKISQFQSQCDLCVATCCTRSIEHNFDPCALPKNNSEEKKHKMHWLHGLKSQLSTNNKILLYKTILKPIWTYGIQLWGTASTSNIETLERFQSKVLRIIVDAPWYVPNSLIRKDLSSPTVKEVIRRYSSHYGDRLRTHPNHLAVNLLRLPVNRSLRRFVPTDLPDRF